MRKLALISTAIVIFASVGTARAHVTSYVFVHGRSNVMTNNVDLDRALRLRDEIGGTFLWFRADGDTYVVHDRETLVSIDRLFEPMRALEPEYESLRRERQPLDDREEQLDREIDRIEERIDATDDDEENETVSDRDERRLLEETMRGLEREMRDVESSLRKFEEREQQLDRRQDEFERDAERGMEPILERAIRSGMAKPF